MGFLMRRFVHLLPAILIAITLESCNPMRVSQMPQLQDSDWPLFGGSIGRSNVAQFQLNPPLTKVWEYDANAGYTPYAMAAEGDFLFISNLQGEIHIVDINTGKKVLSHRFGSAIYGSPVIDGPILYLALSKEEESLISFDLGSGKQKWSAKLGGIETSPLLVGDNLYVVTLAAELFCINKDIGLTRWSSGRPEDGNVAQAHSSPVSDGHAVIFCRDDGAIFAVDAQSGSLQWRTKARKAIFATPSVSEGNLYVGALDSTFYSFDVSNGALRWKQYLDGQIFSSQAVGKDLLYVGTSNGTLYCLNCALGKIVWRYKTQASISAAPVIAGNIIYAGSLDKTLYAFDSNGGAMLWNWKSEGRIKTAPLIHRGVLIVAQDDRTITAFKEKGGVE
jgi:outer membrane protein assembly factor BamB